MLAARFVGMTAVAAVLPSIRSLEAPYQELLVSPDGTGSNASRMADGSSGTGNSTPGAAGESSEHSEAADLEQWVRPHASAKRPLCGGLQDPQAGLNRPINPWSGR